VKVVDKYHKTEVNFSLN